MIYGKYGLCAIKAYEKMQSGMDCLYAWQNAAQEIFGDTPSAKKGCPKNAYLGIFGCARSNSKNAEYALTAIDIIKNLPIERIHNIKPLDFWRDYMHMTKRYNSQIDVVFALLDKGYIKTPCNKSQKTVK